MKYLIFDTETTGLVKDWNNPSHSENPRMVQLGAMLCDENGRALNTYSSIVYPSDFTIPAFVSGIHGITQEMAMDCGKPISEILASFISMSEKADVIIAHNIKFDKVIMSSELIRSGNIFPSKPIHCTMLQTTPICKLIGKRGIKWPKLSEAYEFFFHEKLVDAHDALTDVMACKRIFFHLQRGPTGSGAFGVFSKPVSSNVSDVETSDVQEFNCPPVVNKLNPKGGALSVSQYDSAMGNKNPSPDDVIFEHKNVTDNPNFLVPK